VSAVTLRQLLCGLLLLVAGYSAQAGESLTPLPGGKPAPDFELVDTDGKLHRLSDYRGKTVILNFWATWCPPCREEIPSMNRAWRQLAKEDVVMLAVNMGEDEDTIFVFTADYPAEFPLLLDRDGSVIAQWPVKGLPTTYIIAPDGSIAYRAIGGRNWDDSDIMDILRALQKQRQGAG
jgi:peroxiredoxin